MENCEKCGKDGASKVTYWTDGGGTVYDEGAYEPNPVQIGKCFVQIVTKSGSEENAGKKLSLLPLFFFYFLFS